MLDFSHITATFWNTLRKRTLVQRNCCVLGLSVLPDRSIRCHTDKTIEEAAMKWLKSISGSGTYSAGISGITSNFEASQRHLLRDLGLRP